MFWRRLWLRIRPEVSRKNWACVFGVTLLTFASLLGLQLAKAQTATGTIVGTVTDPKGLPIVEVSVVVRNQDTETESIFPTNAAGIYVAPYLQPGNYQVTASKSGFEMVVYKNVVVHVGDRLTIDVQLSLQTQQTSIIVTEEAPVLETGKTDQSQTVSQDHVEGLPIATRRWQNFLLLTPAVTTDGTSGLSSFRGISGLYNGNSVDGANNTQAFFSEARGRAIIVTYVYSPDSIKEFAPVAVRCSFQLLKRHARACLESVSRKPTCYLGAGARYACRWSTRYEAIGAFTVGASGMSTRTSRAWTMPSGIGGANARLYSWRTSSAISAYTERNSFLFVGK